MKTSLSIAALAALAGTAFAGPTLGTVDRSGYTIYQAEAALMGSPVARGAEQSVYSDLEAGPNGFVAFPATEIDTDQELESLGVADYDSIADDMFDLTSFRFVGGVDDAGGVMFVDFFDAGGAFVDGFGIQLSEAGRFIWTLTLADSISIADAGFVQLSVDDEDLAGAGSATTGQWFLGDAGATIGSAGNEEATPGFNYTFELNTVPTPGAIAIAGLGGLVATRRRRA